MYVVLYVDVSLTDLNENCFNLPQSSSSGALHLVNKNDTDMQMSGHASTQRNNNWSVLWWNALACSYGKRRSWLSSRTSNRC